MRYLLIHCLDETAELSPDDDSDVEGSAAARAQDAWDAEMEARGVMLYGARLQPVSDATTVRVRDGEVLVRGGGSSRSTWLASARPGRPGKRRP